MALTRWDKESRGPSSLSGAIPESCFLRIALQNVTTGTARLARRAFGSDRLRGTDHQDRGPGWKNSFACLVPLERLRSTPARELHCDVARFPLRRHDFVHQAVKSRRRTADTALRRACLGNFDTRALIGDKRIRRLGARPLQRLRSRTSITLCDVGSNAVEGVRNRGTLVCGCDCRRQGLADVVDLRLMLRTSMRATIAPMFG